MKRIYLYLPVLLLFLLPVRVEANDRPRVLYPLLNEKSWSQILEEETGAWSPPRTVNFLIQPVHSPDWLYVNPSLAVSRRRVTEGVWATDAQKVREATTQEDLVLQFAFDDPAFVPDFRLTGFKLEENKYPLVTADYFANDTYYRIEYFAASLSSRQTVLCLNISVKNEGDRERDVHVRTKIGYYPENQIFDYHYIPYSWTAAKWKPYHALFLKDSFLYKGTQPVGKVIPGEMDVSWEKSRQYADLDYEKVLYPHVWYGSGYALPEFRLKNIQDVVHAFKKMKPGETAHFSIEILVDENRILPAHLDALKRLTPAEIKAQATGDFKRELASGTVSLDFVAGQWGDILTALQLNTLQLLIEYPGKSMYQPAQGGSSERFYVWVFEAVQMLRPLLRTGHFEAVKKGLDYIFALQNAGCPPVGRFTTTEGAIGTTGPRWANTTGMALALASDYYLYSGDNRFLESYLPKILQALHWIAGEVKATRRPNADGSRPLTYGVMPFAVASDGDQGYFVSATDVFSYYGFNRAVQLLERLHHPEAVEMRRELERYRSDLLIAIRHLARPDGYIDRKIVVDDPEIREAAKFTNTDIMAPIATVGIMEPAADLFRRYIEYYEKHIASDYFMGKMDRDIFYILQCEHYWQPIYLRLGEWKKAFMTLRTCLKYGITPDTHQTQERFSKRDPFFAPWQPNGSGNGSLIDMLLNAFYFESPDETILLGAVPFEYLIRNGHTSLRNLYTENGKVEMEIEAAGDRSCRLSLSSDRPLPRHLRIPAYLNAEAESPEARKLSGGRFEVKKEAKRISFRLYR